MSEKIRSYTSLFFKKGFDFNRVKHGGRRVQTPHFNLIFSNKPDEATRLGIIVGRRFGNAVLRNRAKRIFRELARTTCKEFVGGKEFLIFPKRQALQTRHVVVRKAWRLALTEAGLMDPCHSS